MDTNSESYSSQPVNKSEETATNCESLEALTAAGFKMLVEATKKSNGLPLGKTRDLYESYPSFHNVVKIQVEYILAELSVMMSRTNCSGHIKKKDDEDKFEMIIDANDSLLENVGIALDELSGINKNPESKFIPNKVEFMRGSWNGSRNNKVTSKAASQILNSILSQTKYIEKPQIKFKDKVNNDSDVPFEPRIKHKYNMLKPLSCILQTTEDGICHFSHPYEFELNKFTPSKEQMVYHPPIFYRSLAETPLVLVNKLEDVTHMVNNLEKYKEIAVDVEHHSYRSFQGFTCLLQISTRDVDYVIDTLALRSELEILNKIFTNPAIVKVFHGADLDIVWLQKDLSVYVVNMFDTHRAAKLLNFPKLSLSYLLSRYCNVEGQKHFQLADWRIRCVCMLVKKWCEPMMQQDDGLILLMPYDRLRNNPTRFDLTKKTALVILPYELPKASDCGLSTEVILRFHYRPLPQELLTYAREDTHYLLFIYDNLRNALIEKANDHTNLLESVIAESTRICLKTYLKPRYESDGYLDIYRRSKKLFDNRQKFALQQLFQWRDAIAREWDESYAYVLPNHMMLNISEILPREAQGILACCNPVPVPVRRSLMALHQIILKSREQPLLKPILEEQKFYRYTSSVNSFDNPLKCPHDLNCEGEFRDDLPVLCSGNYGANSGDDSDSSCLKCSTKPIIDIFESSTGSSDVVKLWPLKESALRLTPYYLYQLSKKFSESIEIRHLNKNNLEKQQENPHSLETEKARNDPNKDCDQKSESTEKSCKEILTYEGGVRENGADTDKPQTSNPNKRKLDDGKTTHAKKKKKTSKNPSSEGEKSDANLDKKKKKKISHDERKKQFQPFDYTSVDFEKYKSSVITSARKEEKIRKRRKKTGKKNFKISV